MISLENIAEEYQLEINGVKFWVPYWVNIPSFLEGPYLSKPNLKGPYKGKGTPSQIRAALNVRLSHTQTKPSSAEDYRRLMRQNGIGIDCSGFVYYALNKYLHKLGKGPLKNYLFIPKKDVLKAYEKYKNRGRRNIPEEITIKRLPDPVPMTDFTNLFHKDARHHTNVARLVSDQAVNPVANAGDIKPADLIKMTSKWGDHMAIVVGITSNSIIYASSDDLANSFGGVGFNKFIIIKPDKPASHQLWSNNNHKKIFDPKKGDGIYRLKTLS